MNQNSISCIIVDDDDFSRETLHDLIDSFSNITILKSLNRSEMAIKYIATLKPDIAFLDINMPGKNGISVLNEINELKLSTKVVFTTSYEDYLLDALKKNAFDYLVKPIKKQDIEGTTNRYLKSTKEDNNSNKRKENSINEQKIVIKNGYATHMIEPKHIVYLEAEGSYTNLHLTSSKVVMISKNIGKIEPLFFNDYFFKISRSIIINHTYIYRIDRLRKSIHLLYNDTCIVLKASKTKMHKLESFISQRQLNQ